MKTYFRAMMWLGRTDFLMTPPEEFPQQWDESDIRRMCYGAVLVNELMEMSGANEMLAMNEHILDFMVGESDNLTPAELTNILSDAGIDAASELLDPVVYNQFKETLVQSPSSEQKILSSIFMADPYSSEPAQLPVSYCLMGQRFVIDSYTLSNVVFDKIVHNGQKVLRLMPDPLDAMFVLGNDDAVHLLEDELEQYPYAGELSAIRYLVDSYDTSFWTSSVYNMWLGGIRSLNPAPVSEGMPYFTTTAAWRQSQLTTQLASWAQLRHDTILYAKQSYSEVVGCLYPHSYVEPNPEFFRQVCVLAENASAFFGSLDIPEKEVILTYFTNLYNHVDILAGLAEKELAGESFSEDEEEFLSTMLVWPGGACNGAASGWYGDLVYPGMAMDGLHGPVIADIHTQPSDESGAIVGKVLHVATGKINLGVFLATSPTDGFRPMAYVGPVQSYYEKVTTGFQRITDEEWRSDVWAKNIPDRPDWVNCYLADRTGSRREDGRMLPHIASPLDVAEEESLPVMFETVAAYPNPFNPTTKIRFSVPEPGEVTVSLYTITGQKIVTLIDEHLNAGTHEAVWNADGLARGVYFCRLSTGSGHAVAKLSLLR